MLRRYDLPHSPCAPFWIPSTDLPSQVAGLGTGMAWSVFNLMFLIAIVLENMPLPGLIGKVCRTALRSAVDCGSGRTGSKRSVRIDLAGACVQPQLS